MRRESGDLSLQESVLEYTGPFSFLLPAAGARSHSRFLSQLFDRCFAQCDMEFLSLPSPS